MQDNTEINIDEGFGGVKKLQKKERPLWRRKVMQRRKTGRADEGGGG